VGGQLLIDQWHDALPTTYVADIYLPGGTTGLQVEFFEAAGMAYIKLWWEKMEVYPDWKGEYFNNPSLQGAPVLVRNDPNVDFNWGTGSPGPGVPADNFSVRWTRTLYFQGGTYHIYAHVDDGGTWLYPVAQVRQQ